ncbi:hypothetical protein [Mycoplasma sp. P36-A1]|uniref:hypothetical protein n=1 Tax=Mycoplasma sp. P36-A1 TaxID=3252900 RepID=UPI003C2C2384
MKKKNLILTILAFVTLYITYLFYSSKLNMFSYSNIELYNNKLFMLFISLNLILVITIITTNIYELYINQKKSDINKNTNYINALNILASLGLLVIICTYLEILFNFKIEYSEGVSLFYFKTEPYFFSLFIVQSIIIIIQIYLVASSNKQSIIKKQL